MARELKYHSQSTDFDALQRELGGEPAEPGHADGDGYSDDLEDEDGNWAAPAGR